MAEKEYDGGDRDQVQAKAQTSATRDKRIQHGLELVLSHADSRLWLYSMLEEAAPFTDPMTGNSWSFHAMGRQAWAKKLISTMLDNNLEAYTKMMKENAKPLA